MHLSTPWAVLLALSVSSVTAEAPTPAATSSPNRSPRIKPSDFVSAVDNAFIPLKPGTTYFYDASAPEGTETIVSSVAFDKEVILGVSCTVVNGSTWLGEDQIAATVDWYAQDKDGNVWFFGHEATSFAGQRPVTTAGSWKAGEDGAQPGITMLAAPKVGDIYAEESAPGVAEDMAEVIRLDGFVRLDTFGERDDCLIVNEWSLLDPSDTGQKVFAPGLGLVQTLDSNGNVTSQLAGVVMFRP